MQHKQLKHEYSRMNRIENVVGYACSDVDANTYNTPLYMIVVNSRVFGVYFV